MKRAFNAGFLLGFIAGGIGMLLSIMTQDGSGFSPWFLLAWTAIMAIPYIYVNIKLEDEEAS